jgi:hypothetical protein
LNGADPEYIECFAANFITFWEQESTGFSGWRRSDATMQMVLIVDGILKS